jgi:DNA-binding MarR family transcriptional regulator
MNPADNQASRSESLRRLEAEVGVLIRRIRRVIHERARAVHEDMQPSAYLLLASLAEEGPVRASAIAESFGIDKGAISRQIQHLVDLGLVTREPDPDDGRATLVAASDDAVHRMRDVAAHRRKWMDEQLGDWSAAELAAFADTLARYNDALNQ